MNYTYTLDTVIKVVDGDTVDITVSRVFDFGFRVIEKKSYSGRFRIVTIDTPERGQPGFSEAAEFARAWLARHQGLVFVDTYKADSFGRYLADLYLPSGESLAGELLRAGLAVPYER